MNGVGEILFDLNRDWKDGKIRMDYRWEDENNKEYFVRNIPCLKVPFGNHNYLGEQVNEALSIIMDLQGNGSFEEDFDFEDVEDMLDDLIGELK